MTDRPKLALARRLRKQPVVVERVLWDASRDHRLHGLKFRRQVPIGRYVVDFVCLRHRLIIEADGPFHDPVYDAERDGWLTGQGFRVLRFTNSEIAGRSGIVLAKILAAISGNSQAPGTLSTR